RSTPSAAARWAKPRPTNWRVLPLLLLLISAASLLLAIGFLQVALGGVLRRANALGRQCAPGLEGRSGGEDGAGHRRRIAIVSFSDEGGGRGPGRGRSFSGVGKAVAGNKQAYAARMGYVFVDAGGMVDHSRPPSWSKILAVRSQLPHYDWVFWNDAFLQTWWNKTSFVRFGSTKSGDNDALKHLLRTLPAEELRAHVAVSPAQCLFNSYPWVPTLKSLHRLFTSPRTTWNGVYSDGDFLLHLAGLDDKKKWVFDMLDEMRPV
ncbi:hypothetical protein GW17_00060620, partial [Ensete ventricosum]